MPEKHDPITSSDKSTSKESKTSKAPKKGTLFASSKKKDSKSNIIVSDLSKTAVLEFIKQLAVFKTLPLADLESLAEVAWFANVQAKDYLKFEGDQVSKNCFIVVSGRLAMMKTSSNGRQLIVELLGAHDIFGLIAALAAKCPLGMKQLELLSALAHVNSVILYIPISALERTLNNNPDVYPELVAYLLDHLHSSYRLARGLAHDRVEVRIAAILLTLSDHYARYHDAHQPLIDITRQQLANLAGTTIESAIRVTRDMEKAKILELKLPGEITLVSAKGLEQIVDDAHSS